MKYSKFGITLHLLTEGDIEMVRQWRNAPHILANMEYRDFITPEMQKKWFDSIHNIHNMYFIIEYKNERIGLTNVKNIDFEKRTGEAGIFLYDKKFYRTSISAILTIMGAEMLFSILKWTASYAHVLRENKSTKMYLRFLGYRLFPGQENKINQKFVLTEKAYRKNNHLLRAAMSMVVDLKERGKLLLENSENEDERILYWEQEMRKINPGLEPEYTDEGRIYYF